MQLKRNGSRWKNICKLKTEAEEAKTEQQHTFELSLNNIGKGSTNKHKERKTLNTHDNIFRWLEHLKSLVSNKHQNRQGHCLQETI